MKYRLTSDTITFLFTTCYNTIQDSSINSAEAALSDVPDHSTTTVLTSRAIVSVAQQELSFWRLRTPTFDLDGGVAERLKAHVC